MDRYPRSLAIKQRALETPPCLARRPDRGVIAGLSQSSRRFGVPRKVSVPRYSPAVDIEVVARGPACGGQVRFYPTPALVSTSAVGGRPDMTEAQKIDTIDPKADIGACPSRNPTGRIAAKDFSGKCVAPACRHRFCWPGQRNYRRWRAWRILRQRTR
jgi:hypothetical protein